MREIIIFDLGKVVLDFDRSLITSKLSRLSGAPEEDISSYIFQNLDVSFDRGEIGAGEFFLSIKQKYGLSISFEEFKGIWNPVFNPNPGIEGVIAALERSYRLGILSNTNELHFEYIMNTYPVMKRFRDYHLSYRMKCRKPEPVIYRKVIEFYGRPAESLVFIDDLEENVAAAVNMGFKAIQYRSAEQLKCEFLSREINA